MANRGGSRMSSKARLAPDRSVVSEIAQGDIEALGELMRRHGRTVYALAYSILVDRGEADDVVAETFEQARRAAAPAVCSWRGSGPGDSAPSGAQRAVITWRSHDSQATRGRGDARVTGAIGGASARPSCHQASGRGRGPRQPAFVDRATAGRPGGARRTAHGHRVTCGAAGAAASETDQPGQPSGYSPAVN